MYRRLCKYLFFLHLTIGHLPELLEEFQILGVPYIHKWFLNLMIHLGTHFTIVHKGNRLPFHSNVKRVSFSWWRFGGFPQKFIMFLEKIMNCLPFESVLGFLLGGWFSWLSDTWVMLPIVINIHIYIALISNILYCSSLL